MFPNESIEVSAEKLMNANEYLKASDFPVLELMNKESSNRTYFN